MKVLDSVFDFKDRVNESLGRETRKEWNLRMLNEYYEYLKGLDVLGLSEILEEIKNNWESGFYADLMLAYVSRDDGGTQRVFKVEELSQNKLMFLAKEYLPRTDAKTIALSITDVNNFKTLHVFIETVYFLNKGCPASWEDSLNVYFGGLAEKLVLNLDKFDELEKTPEPTAEFFQKLGKTKIASEETSDISLKISALLMHIEGEIFGMNFNDFDSDYRPTEGGFINLLAGCSAALDNREIISPDDIIKAYKTFFKLIKTDVTVYKAHEHILKEMPEYAGYLVCKECGTYYPIPEGESTDDYSDVCVCGGKLEYKDEL